MRSVMRDKKERVSVWIFLRNFIRSKEKRQNKCCGMKMEFCMQRPPLEKQQ